jgi:hypothetical protein
MLRSKLWTCVTLASMAMAIPFLLGCNREKAPEPLAAIEPSELLKRLEKDRETGEIERRLIAKAPKIEFNAKGSLFTSKQESHVQVILVRGWDRSDQHSEYRRIVLAEIEEYLKTLVGAVGATITEPISKRSEDGFVFAYKIGEIPGKVEVSNPRKWTPNAGVGDFWIKASEVSNRPD